ncbi:MAG: NAD(P)/FAD-dependent oxidoreductase [Pseudomonadota bacterium]
MPFKDRLVRDKIQSLSKGTGLALPIQRIAIVGCGPGGMALALLLARLGHDITLFEQFAEPGPIGSGLLIQPSGQQVLYDLGLLDTIKNLGSPVIQLHGTSVLNNRRALDMKYAHTGSGIPALGIHRASLFQTLMTAVIKQGIPIAVDSEMIGVEETGSAICPKFREKQMVENFDILVDASGANSPLASGRKKDLKFGAFWTTVDMPPKHDIMPQALDQRYFRAEKMAGIMPVGVNPATGNPGAAVFWSERPEEAQGTIDAGITAFRSNYCRLWPEAEPFVSQIESVKSLTMAVYAHRTGRTSSSQRLFHIGDSWHCTSPQLGQGANMALMDAAALAKAMANTDSLSDMVRNYRKARTFHIRLYQMLSWVFTPLYQSDSHLLPMVRDTTIHNFARLPLIRGLIARTVSGRLGWRGD